jgi:hypothetical protein
MGHLAFFGLNTLPVNECRGIAVGVIQRIASTRLARELSETMIKRQLCIALKWTRGTGAT